MKRGSEKKYRNTLLLLWNLLDDYSIIVFFWFVCVLVFTRFSHTHTHTHTYIHTYIHTCTLARLQAHTLTRVHCFYFIVADCTLTRSVSHSYTQPINQSVKCSSTQLHVMSLTSSLISSSPRSIDSSPITITLKIDEVMSATATTTTTTSMSPQALERISHSFNRHTHIQTHAHS